MSRYAKKVTTHKKKMRKEDDNIYVRKKKFVGVRRLLKPASPEKGKGSRSARKHRCSE